MSVQEEERGQHENQPEQVAEPPRPNMMVETGGTDGAVVQEHHTIRGDLEELLEEIKTNFDAKNVEAGPLIKFVAIIDAYKAQIETRQDPVGEAADSSFDKFLYDKLIAETAKKLVTFNKTDVPIVTEIVHKSITSLFNLLIVELHKKTASTCALVKAIRPLFDPSKVFYQRNDQGRMPADSQPADFEEVKEPEQQQQQEPKPQPKKRQNPQNDRVQIGQISADELEWRNRLCQGTVIDAVLSDEICGIAGWVKAEVVEIVGDYSKANMGDFNGKNVKFIGIQYLNQERMFTKHYRADSTQIAHYDEKTEDDIWRYKLKQDDEIDFLKAGFGWETGVITRIDSIEGLGNCPMVEIAFRIFKNGQTKLKDRRQMASVFSLQVQRPYTMGKKNDDSPNKTMWKLEADDPFAYDTSADLEDVIPMVTAEEEQKAIDMKKQQEQDEQDMAMVTDPDQRFFAALRQSCKSTFFVQLLNSFGEADAFDQIIELINQTDTGLSEVQELVKLVTESSKLYHKQFIDAYCQRFCNAIEAKLLGTTPAQLGLIRPCDIDEIIRLVWQKLFRRKLPNDNNDSQIIRGKMNLKVGINLLRHSKIEKRKDGAKIVEGVIQDANMVSPFSLQTQIYAELIQTMKQQNILDLFFSTKYLHEVLIKKSLCVLKLFIKQDGGLTPEELGSVWDECQGHDSTALEMVNVCQLLLDCSIDEKFQQIFVDKLIKKPNAAIRPREMQFMLKMGRKVSVSADIQEKVIEFFWTYIFDDSAPKSEKSAAHAYLTEKSATSALDALRELLILTQASTIERIFARLIEKVRQRDHGYFVVSIASKFIQSFVMRGELHVKTLLTRAEGEPSLLSLLIGELQDYLEFVKTQVSADVSKLAYTCFVDIFAHRKQLQERMDFIKDVANKAHTQIRYEEFAQIWVALLTQNPILSDHAVAATWMRSFADDLMLGRSSCPTNLEELVRFYRESLCADGASYVDISVEGYSCVQSYFLLSNLLQENIIINDHDVKKADLGRNSAHNGAIYRSLQHDKIETQSRVEPTQMDGIGVLWQIAINAQDEQVYARVANFLLKLHSQIEAGFESQLKVFEDSFVESCVRILQGEKTAMRAALEGASTNTEQRRIKAGLKLLQMLVLVSEKSGKNGVSAHSALPQNQKGKSGGASLAIPSNFDFLEGMIVKNFFHTDLQKKQGAFTIDMDSQATVLDFKQKLCTLLMIETLLPDGFSTIIDIPDVAEIQIRYCREKRLLREDDEDGKTLKQLGFEPQEKLYVQRKKVQKAAPKNEESQNGAANRPPSRTMPDMPRWKIAQHPEQFELIMSLQDVQGEVANEASNMLLMLCTNEQVFRNVLQLQQDNDCTNTPFDWKSIFSEDIKLTMYCLDIIETIIKTTQHENDDGDDAAEKALKNTWVQRFLQQGGFQLFMGQVRRAITQSSASQQNAILHRRFMAQVLRLLKTFIFAAICANNDGFDPDVDSMVAQSTLIRTKSVDQHQQSTMGQKEENGFHAGWTDRLSSGMEVVAKPTRSSGKQQFEQSARFKQIVECIREEDLAGKLMALVDLSDMQSQLFEILANLLADDNSSNIEMEGIINGALSLITFALNRQNDLVEQVFSWTRKANQNSVKNFADLVITGIYCTKSKAVREEFKSLVNLIATTAQSNQAAPIISLIKILMEHLPGRQHENIDSSQSAEFFSILCSLIQQYRKLSEEATGEQHNNILSVEQMFQDVCTQLKRHESAEQDSQGVEDPTLTGLLRLSNELLDWFAGDASVTYEQIIAFSQRNSLMHEFFYEHLFFMPGMTKSPGQNKCKSKGSRTQAYILLYKLVEALKPAEMQDFQENYLWRVVNSVERPEQWMHKSAGHTPRSKAKKYIGLKNYGNICYMISMLQQLFMVPQFRYRLMTAIDSEEASIKTYREREVDDRLLTQLQRLFGFLELSDKSYGDPFDLCFAFKDWDGNPTSLGEQKDAQEFVTAFFGKTEDLLTRTDQKYLLQDTFQFSQVVEMRCLSCGKTKHSLRSDYMLQVQVKDQENLAASLQMELSGQVIDDYSCEGCNQKVQIKKRNLLGDMPNVLFVHEQRIELDLTTFQQKKICTKFDFPDILDLKPFSFKEQVASVQPETAQEEREALEKLLETDDDDYTYRLVGVNIHRGQITHGHYWSYINTRRGDSEPKINGPEDDNEWQRSVETDWLKFDDNQVSTANMIDLRKDAIGGGSSSTSDWDTDSGKSAYMLIYERKRKKDVREVTSAAEVKEAETEEATKAAETVKLVSGRDVESIVPAWIEGIVEKDNLEFCFDRQVFDKQFFFLVKLVLKRVSVIEERSEIVKNLHRSAAKVSHRVMYELLPAFGENHILTDVHEYLITFLQPEIVGDWIEHLLLKDESTVQYIFKLMIECPTAHTRTQCCNLVAKMINKTYELLNDQQDAQATRLKTKLDVFLIKMIECIFTKECQRMWQKLEQFYTMVADIFTGGQHQTELLLARNSAGIVVDLCDLIMQEKSPKATNDRVKMGNIDEQAPFNSLCRLLYHLIASMTTQTMDEDAYIRLSPFSQPSNHICLSDEAIEYFTNEYMLKIVIDGYIGSSYFRTNFAKALAHVCYGNIITSKKVLRTVLQLINKASQSQIINQMRLIGYQLLLDDAYQQQRLEWVLGFPTLQFMQSVESIKVGVEITEHDIYAFTTTLFSQKDQNCMDRLPLLALLQMMMLRAQESKALRLLEPFFETFTQSEMLMEYLSELPTNNILFTRFTDWISTFLTQEVNKRLSVSNTIEGVSYDTVVYLMTKSVEYEEFVRKRDEAIESRRPYAILGSLSDKQVCKRVGDENTVSLIISHFKGTHAAQYGRRTGPEEGKESKNVVAATAATSGEMMYEWQGVGTKTLGDFDAVDDQIEYLKQNRAASENDTGDQREKQCDDLIYKFELVNHTGNPILYSIKFEKETDADLVNLRWPINGIKGRTNVVNSTIAMLPKVRPTAQTNGTNEVEKLNISLTWAPNGGGRKYDAEICQLRDMGIDADEETISSILDSTNGNVEAALGLLFG